MWSLVVLKTFLIEIFRLESSTNDFCIVLKFSLFKSAEPM